MAGWGRVRRWTCPARWGGSPTCIRCGWIRVWLMSRRCVAVVRRRGGGSSGARGGWGGGTLKRVREQLRAVPGDGLGYGLLRYVNPQTGPRLAGLASAQVGFNYL